MSGRHRQARRDQPSSQDEGLWVRSGPMGLDGVYGLEFSLEGSHAWSLTRDEAFTYSMNVLEAVERARYDAAAVTQMHSLGVPKGGLGQLLRDLRDERPLLAWPGPLSWDGIVSSRTGQPLMNTHHESGLDGEITTRQAERHAVAVLQAMIVADLDNAYKKVLTVIGVEQPQIEQVIHHLVEFREDDSWT